MVVEGWVWWFVVVGVAVVGGEGACWRWWCGRWGGWRGLGGWRALVTL